MFRIPLKLGKNNDIEEVSDIGGLTDRGLSSRRSIGKLSESSIFEERMGGNGFDIFDRKQDIVDLDFREIPIELMGETHLQPLNGKSSLVSSDL